MPIKILLDDSPLHNANAIRGVGMYTKFLSQHLALKKSEIELSLSKDKDLTFKPDLIHYPFFDLFFPTLPFIKKKKTIVTIHDVIPLLYKKFYPVGKRGQLAFMRQKLALRSVEAVITDSQTSKTDIAKHLGVPMEKIHVVSLAANPELKMVSEETVKKVLRKYSLPKKYMLYVGDINYNKNIPQLIKTLKFLPKDIKLVCVGKNFYPHEIPEWQWIESQIALSNVSERVIFLSDISGEKMEDLSAIYSGALVYIQPSLYEGFGLPVLEAMACGTAVICADNSSLSEIALNQALLVKEARAEDFAQAVESYIDMSSEEKNKLQQRALKYARRFTWSKTAAETITVYKHVLKK